MLGISACLGGIACRYDGSSQTVQQLAEWVKNGEALMVCPEVLGDLPTPREPAEIVGGDGYDVLAGRARVMDKSQADVTEAFLAGAKKAYEELKKMQIDTLILKENSPSCGSGNIYDGSFSGIKKSGVGVATAYFESQGMKVYSENNWFKLLKED